MTEHSSLPVPGYTTQSSDRVAIVTQNKQLEERVLRQIDRIAGRGGSTLDASEFDQRWVALARTQIEQGFMALNRAVFQPQRVELAEDRPQEFAWLIEDAESPVSRPQYLAHGAPPVFSIDPHGAMRFPRREDAEAVALIIYGAGFPDLVRIAEHGFG